MRRALTAERELRLSCELPLEEPERRLVRANLIFRPPLPSLPVPLCAAAAAVPAQTWVPKHVARRS